MIRDAARAAACAMLLAYGAGAQSMPPLAISDGLVPGERRGWSVADAGDVNGDGIPDLWIGSPYDPGAGIQAGAVRAISGRDGSELNLLFGTAAVDHFGWALASLGDLDGDGISELAIGAPENDFQATNAGEVRVVSGASGTTRYRVPGTAPGGALGYSLARLGDVDGDGWSDFCAGAPFDPTGGTATGSIDVRSGVNGALLARHPGAAAGDRLGISVAWAGDVDGDGWPDVLGGADQLGISAGCARWWSGASGALLREVAGQASGERFGAAVAGGLDFDGDGVPDLLAGAPAAGASAGAARVHSGADGSQLLSVLGDGPGESFGLAVALVPDLDGDARAELAVGAGVHQGAPGGPGILRALSSRNHRPLRAWIGRSGGDRFGSAIAVVADRDGDGLAELLAGAPKDDAPAVDCGAAFVLSTRAVAPLPYCTAKTSSQGCVPAIAGEGFASIAGQSALALSTRQVLPQKPGLYLFSAARAATPFLGGILCLAPPVRRSGGLVSSAGPSPCSGVLGYSVGASVLAQHGWPAGARISAQAWYRDPLHPDGTASGLGDALEFTVWQ